MKLFWHPKTRAARIVWLLEEAGVAYECVAIDIRDPHAPRDPGFAEASPMGKVPAIVDGDVCMADSAAIGIYVADRYPACGLAPGVEDSRRGAYLYWMLYAPGVMEPALMEKFAGLTPNRFSAGWGDFDAMIETLAKGLEAWAVDTRRALQRGGRDARLRRPLHAHVRRAAGGGRPRRLPAALRCPAGVPEVDGTGMRRRRTRRLWPGAGN